jgi:hypothetical protein
LFVIENVKGAAAEMEEHAVLIYGSYFGLRVDRPRFFEANFDLHVDEFLRVPGLALRSRGCLGPRRKWRRMYPFGRPEMTECCGGTLYPMQGLAPHGFTADEGAWAMGIDPCNIQTLMHLFPNGTSITNTHIILAGIPIITPRYPRLRCML